MTAGHWLLGGMAGSVLVMATEVGSSGAELERELPTAGAQVTLPYEEFRTLWMAAESQSRAAELRPPVAGWVSSAEYDLALDDRQSVLEAD